MKRTIISSLLCVVLVIAALASSCSSGVSQEQYDKLNQEAVSLRARNSKATLYMVFLDRLMYQVFKGENLPTREEFSTQTDWYNSLDTVASALDDSQLISLLAELKKDPQAHYFEVANYVIGKTGETLAPAETPTP